MVFNPLYIVWNFNPVLFSVGGLDIRYYGLMWALAILVGAKFFDNFCKREGLPSSVSESIFIYGTLATILGARVTAFFTSRSTILRIRWRSSPKSVTAVWRATVRPWGS